MKIANINTKSNYSLLKSNLRVKTIIDKAVSNNQTHVFLADDNLYCSIEFIKIAKKNSLIPVVGLEVFYKGQLILMFPKSEVGYKNIIKISSFTLQNSPYDLNDFIEDVIFLCENKLNFPLNTKDIYENYSQNLAINKANYAEKKENEVIQIMDAIKNEKKLSTENLIESDDFLLLNEEEFNNKFSKEKIKKTIEIFKSIFWDFSITKSEILKFNNSTNTQKKNLINQICVNNLLEILEKDFLPEEYKNRLEYEIKIINDKGFNDYFLIVHDFISEAINRGILVGPGRGSVAGSLVAYGLKITMVDPLKYNLMFERFLNPNRSSMPDIDVDIMDTRRDEIIEYLFEKYGYEKVAHIITFQRMKSKMALRDVGRVLGIDLKIISRISKLITPEYDANILGAIASKKELKSFYDEYPKLFDVAQKLIGCPRQTGKHAAGIVLSEKKLIDIIPIQHESNNVTTTQISMEFLEELGLIKMDLLGLSNLTIIQRVMKLIKIATKEIIDLRKIPLDNKRIYDAISSGRTFGIFQLESPGMKKTLTLVKPRNIEDISIVSALFRPGPQNNIKSFVARREGLEPVEYVDERVKEIVKETNGIIIYQEQVIEIVKSVANFSVADADIFRKAMSKKQESIMASLKQEFIDGAIKNGYSEKHTAEIFEYIEKFALYGFNHSHSISYALISYWMMYFKIYFPIEFYSVALSTLEGSHEKIFAYCIEIIEQGISILPPDINLSKRNFIILNQKIYFGFSAIKGIGNEISKKIILTRDSIGKFESYEQAIGLLLNAGVGETTLAILIKSGCFDVFCNRKYALENIKNVAKVSKNIKEDGTFLFQPQLEDVVLESDEKAKIYQEQLNLIGFNFSKDKKIPQKISDLVKNMKTVTLNLIPMGNSRVIVKIVKLTPHMMKNGREMAFLTISDDTKTDRVAWFNYSQSNEIIDIDSFYIVTIKKQERGSQLVDLEKIYE